VFHSRWRKKKGSHKCDNAILDALTTKGQHLPVMSSHSHRNHSNKHALPSNPAFIEFTRSDGDSALWPTNTTREIDEEGCVNFMQPVGLDEPLSVKWRVGVGDALSVALKLSCKFQVSPIA
jgi:hypothetical protein